MEINGTQFHTTQNEQQHKAFRLFPFGLHKKRSRRPDWSYWTWTHFRMIVCCAADASPRRRQWIHQFWFLNEIHSLYPDWARSACIDFDLMSIWCYVFVELVFHFRLRFPINHCVSQLHNTNEARSEPTSHSFIYSRLIWWVQNNMYRARASTGHSFLFSMN